MYNHYIRINGSSEIIYAFSSAFEEPIEGDILLGSSDQRHVHYYDTRLLSFKKFPPETGYKWKYIDGQIVENS